MGLGCSTLWDRIGQVWFKYLIFLCCLSMGVYSTMVAGWSSNCKYSLLGSLRAVAQTISYEVSLALILLSFVILVGEFNVDLFDMYQCDFWFIIIGLPLGLVWFSPCLAETNRTPFDFAEGESELVSGFNTWVWCWSVCFNFYGGVFQNFVLFVILFLGGSLFSILFYLKSVMIAYVFVWVRGTLPRFRYDKLMYLAWKSYLPVSINYLIFFLGFEMFLFSFIYN